MSSKIADVLQKVRIEKLDLKAPSCLAPSATLAEAYRILDLNRTGAVLVCEGDSVVGIFTDRDILYRTALGEVPPETPISELMSADVVTVEPNRTVAEAIAAMNRGGHRHLPLVDAQGVAVGLISGRDILRFVAGYIPEVVLNLPPRLHQNMPRAEGG